MLQEKLLAWFVQNARRLPWRGTRDAYRVWVSEIMLQQTQVATVIDYFTRFMESFPTVTVLADASEEDVLRHWEGLGYYRRARQLHAAARVIRDAHAGCFPEDFAAVLALPGVGRYTAGAVLSIAKNQRLPILEANTVRLFARLIALEEPVNTAAAQKRLWAYAESLVASEKYPPGEVNQALMEVGSLVCTPRGPRCDACPLRDFCEAHQQDRVAEIPVAAPKMRYEDRREAAVVITRPAPQGTEVCLLRYAPHQRWGGLWDFPRTEVPEDAAVETLLPAFTRETTGLRVHLGTLMKTLRHSVTKYRITLDCYRGELPAKNAGRLRKKTPHNEEIRWVAIKDLSDYPLSVTGRKIARLVSQAPNP